MGFFSFANGMGRGRGVKHYFLLFFTFLLAELKHGLSVKVSIPMFWKGLAVVALCHK